MPDQASFANAPWSRRTRRVNGLIDKVSSFGERFVIAPDAIRPRLFQRFLQARSKLSDQEFGKTLVGARQALREARQDLVSNYTTATMSRPVMTSTAGGLIGDGVKSLFAKIRP